MKHFTAILAVTVMIIVGLACSGDDTEKANGLVAEANKFVGEANENVKKAESKGLEYDAKLGKIATDADLNELREFAKEIIKHHEGMKESFEKAGGKFAEAGNLKLNEKFKEYLGIKADEMKKRAEYAAEIKKIPQALIDSKTQKEYVADAQKYGANAKKFLEEAKEMAEKADKIVKDNPTIIKAPGN